MATTWADIAESEDFKNLHDGDREKVRTNFYKERVDPLIPEDQKKAAVGMFYDKTQDDVLPLEVRTPEDAIPEIAGSKGVGAFLVGMGSSMRDTYDGAKQIFSIGEEQLEKDKAFFSKLQDSEYSGTVLAGQILGFVAEPIGVMVPVAKGKSLFQIAKIGAMTGAGFGAIGYVDTHKDQTRMGNALLGAFTGGTLSPAFAGIGRGIMNKGVIEAEMKGAKQILTHYNSSILKFQSKGFSRSMATRATKRLYSYTDDDITAALMKTERKAADLGAESTKDASRMLEGKMAMSFNPEKTRAEVKASLALYRLPGVGDKIQYGMEILKKNASHVSAGVNDVMTPISSRLGRINAKLGFTMRKMEAESHLKVAKAFNKTNPFNNSYDTITKWNPQLKADLNKSLLSGDFKRVRSLLAGQKNGAKIVKEFDDVTKVLDGLYKELGKVGYKIPKLKNYWPRIVSNMEGVTKVEHSIIKREYNRLAKIKGAALNDDDKAKAIKHLFSPGQQEKLWGQTSSSLNKRKWSSLDDEMMENYADAMDGLNHYIHQNVNDISRRRFMKSHGYKKNPKIDGSDLEDGIQDVVRKMRDKGELGLEQEHEVIDILKARFGPGEQAPGQLVQNFKNSTYALLLGNPVSALTQFGDLAFSGYKYGVKNAVTSMFGKKLVKKEMLGLMDAIEEFAGDRNKLKKLADWSFKWGGFNKVDRLGKETFVNSALKHFNKMVLKGDKGREQFRKQWSGVFGKETDRLMDDIGKKNLTDNVKLMLWNELSDVQPISLSEMPLKYLQSPNGRVLYTLKTFTVKQLDFMRKQIVDEAAKGNHLKAAKNFAKFSGG